MPDAAKEALDRSSAEFTAGRLSELAQHARQAAARAAVARLPADQDAGQPGEPVADLAAAEPPGPDDDGRIPRLGLNPAIELVESIGQVSDGSFAHAGHADALGLAARVA